MSLSPARPLEPVVLEGRTVRLEPLDADRHAAALFEAAQGDGADPLVWRYMWDGPFADAAEYAAWARTAAAGADPQFYAIVVDALGGPSGVASYLRIEPAHACIEIGHIWFGGRMQRTTRRPRRSSCCCATPSTTSATGAWSGSATPPTRGRAPPPSASASRSRASSAST